MPVNIFFCYAREDEALLNMLKSHLRPLQREGLIAVWHDREIRAGDEWQHEIDTHLNTAQIILLLVSPAFMNSDYCYGIEMKRALERHERGDAKVIPVIMRPVYWHGKPLGKLQALPTDGKPVTSAHWHDVGSALYDVTAGVYKVVEEWDDEHASEKKEAAEATQPEVALSSNIPPIIQPIINTTPVIVPLAVEKLQLLHTLKGHNGAVYGVAISGDGRTVVSGGRDETIKVWNLATGKEVRTLSGHAGTVRSVAISENEKMVVSGSDNKTIKVWDLATGKEVRTLSGHISRVYSVVISGFKDTLVSGGSDGMIKVWSLATGKEVRTLSGRMGGIVSLAISPDGETLVSGDESGVIKIWQLSTGKEMRTLSGHTGVVWSLAISSDGQTLVSGSGDGSINRARGDVV